MREEETLTNLDFGEEIKMIDICALGPLRVSASLINAGLMKEGSKIIVITSQGGSVAWRTTQNPEGHDYGHHVSNFGALKSQGAGSAGHLTASVRPPIHSTDVQVCCQHDVCSFSPGS